MYVLPHDAGIWYLNALYMSNRNAVDTLWHFMLEMKVQPDDEVSNLVCYKSLTQVIQGWSGVTGLSCSVHCCCLISF